MTVGLAADQFLRQLRTVQPHSSLRGLFKSKIIDPTVPDELPVDDGISLVDLGRRDYLNLILPEQINGRLDL